MNGTLYGIGTGPGDPEDMTLKAVRILKECPVAAIPKKDFRTCLSYQIAVQAVPELREKELMCINVPMIKDRRESLRRYEEGAAQIAACLSEGRDVALLTLGDATIYASDLYLIRLVRDMGFRTEIINGIPSFCSAAARLLVSLGERDEAIHILPGSYGIEEGLKLPGVKVLMKMGKSYEQIKKLLTSGGFQVQMAENCGMDDEKLYGCGEELPEKAGYYSLMIVRDRKGRKDT